LNADVSVFDEGNAKMKPSYFSFLVHSVALLNFVLRRRISFGASDTPEPMREGIPVCLHPNE